MSFDIRSLHGFEELEECERIQREVWGFEDVEIVPAGFMAVMGHHGAVAAGAFADGRMAGFVAGFPAFDGTERVHHSHMLAVRRESRGLGMGVALKWAQADRVLAQGIRRIQWTFDPLRARNANLNLNRLGAVAKVYRRNVYGKSPSPLHGGLPTDRLEVDWVLDSDRVKRAREGRPAPAAWDPKTPRANRARVRPDGLEESSDPDGAVVSGGAGDEVLLQIPRDLSRMLEDDPALALDWRLRIRSAFGSLFGSGFVVTGFHDRPEGAFHRLSRPADGPSNRPDSANR